MGKLQETILYYRPDPDIRQSGCLDDKQVRLLKSVLIRMGIRIKNIRPEQLGETVGYLAGIPGYAARSHCPVQPAGGADQSDVQAQPAGDPAKSDANTRPLCQDILLLHHFTDSRIDSLLLNLRKSGVPSIPLKAVITPQNAGWTICHLYEELKKEHEAMHQNTPTERTSQ